MERNISHVGKIDQKYHPDPSLPLTHTGIVQDLCRYRSNAGSMPYSMQVIRLPLGIMSQIIPDQEYLHALEHLRCIMAREIDDLSEVWRIFRLLLTYHKQVVLLWRGVLYVYGGRTRAGKFVYLEHVWGLCKCAGSCLALEHVWVCVSAPTHAWPFSPSGNQAKRATE